MSTVIVITLAALVALLAALGVATGNNAALTLAASALTGLFAYLQVRDKGGA
jgi:hypothetical protein